MISSSRHALLLVLLLSSTSALAGAISLLPQMGTLGAGLGLEWRLSEHLGISLTHTGSDFNGDTNVGSTRYRGELTTRVDSLMLNFAPGAGYSRWSLGLARQDLRLDMELSSALDPQLLLCSPITVRAALPREYAPMVAFSMVTNPDDKAHLGGYFTVGALFAGDVDVNMNSRNNLLCASALREQEQALRDKLGALPFYPVVQAGLSLRF